MRVLEMFPLQKFAIHDEPLSDRLEVGRRITERTDTHQQGSLRDGDMLLLATDAVAAWLLKRHEEGRPIMEMALPEAEYARELCRNGRLRPQKMDCATTTFTLGPRYSSRIHRLKRRRTIAMGHGQT